MHYQNSIISLIYQKQKTMTPTTEQIQHLVNCLNNGSELQIVCKDGQVCIPSNSLYTWTYVGSWGSLVLRSEIKAQVRHDNLLDRLALLQAHMNAYSSNVSGINIVTVK